MDEVDIDNEDLNELEARLYAQIHHEATDKPNTENETHLLDNETTPEIATDTNNVQTPEDNFGIPPHTNKTLSKRYWATQNIGKEQQQTRFIRNPFKAPNPFSKKFENQQIQSKQFENTSNAPPNLSKTNSPGNKKRSSAEKVLESTKDTALSPSLCNDKRKSKKLSANRSNLKLNPVAISKKANFKRNNLDARNNSINIKQGLFARQQQKLEKAKRIEEKKQKSKRAKKLSAAIANAIKPLEIVNLDSDNESNCSDVVVIPSAPLPTFTIDDSADEENDGKVSITMEQEDNALDSTDVQMSKTTASFIKPQEIHTQSSTSADCGEKRVENSSRCTSPCSIQSSDDFIGQTDRSRLLAGPSGMADDEDLLVLTSDISSLQEVPDISKHVHDEISKEKVANALTVCENRGEDKNMEANEFATPNATKPQPQPRDYRVDQGQFRAIDVYESESDITDSVYSKGVNKSTVIRQIDTSSDEVEDIGSSNQKVKRLRKRRASSNNKESEPINENSASSSDVKGDDEDMEVDDVNTVLRTPIPFIAKGVAVERYKPRKRSLTLSSGSPLVHKRKLAKTAAATDHMSDTEFIATLNNLVQGQEAEQEKQITEEDEESDTENIPTAREIAEKVLAHHSAKEKCKEPDDVALPDDILNKLDEVFETIDQMGKETTSWQHMSDDTVQISDSSDCDRENNLSYHSVPNEEAQIIEYSTGKSKTNKSPAKTHADNGSPIYNIIYIRGYRKQDGVGWNNEMRKFYTESWNGEHFTLGRVLQKMNPDKSLWEISAEDRFNLKLTKRNNKKCMNCCEFGHTRSKCNKPRKPLICYMCGDSGHYEPRCPNTICLRCGNKTQVFTKSCNACSYQNRLTCPICKIRGHSLDYCPDKWRRYHSTTEGNAYLNNRVDYNTRKHCCICGARGHLSDCCRSAVRFLEYPAISNNVKSHQKSYSDVVLKTPHNGIGLNLMYKPCEEYKLKLVGLTSVDKYYFRFLKAVGLDYLYEEKRNLEAVTTETAVSTAENSKRLLQKYEPNPYLKAAAANQKKTELTAPNQVQEITESGNIDQKDSETDLEQDVVITIDDKNDDEIECVDSTMDREEMIHIQLHTTNGRSKAEQEHDKSFKSPKNVTSTSSASPSKTFTEPISNLDSDSNYSFSDHFDVALSNSRPKPRKMEILPDFIPINDSTEAQNEQRSININSVTGISKIFLSHDSEHERNEDRRSLSPLPELPCEAKIYLTHFHTKYLLSPVGSAFLIKASRAHKLKARLDFASVGYVLVIFGLPSNQNKFQRELLLRYRGLEDEINQKQLQCCLNIPKRTHALIKFLREGINQLFNNFGSVDRLLKRLIHLEQQQTKNSNKLADKVRKSLNMILVGQAGLQDGTMHLDKLLVSLKKLLNDVDEEFAPLELRSEVGDHWKVIFSSYRHENYSEMVDTYKKLVSKNRMSQINIDPLLLGPKVLNTSFSEEQKQKLEQTKTESTNQMQRNTKRKQNTDPAVTSTPASNKTITPTSAAPTPTNDSTTAAPSGRTDNSNSSANVKTKSTLNNVSSLLKSDKTHVNTTTPIANKSKQSLVSINTKPSTTAINSKEIMPPPPFANPEKRSAVSTTIHEVTVNWENTCDTLLSEISSENPNTSNGDRACDSVLPSTFWSRESMRYLDECVHLSSGRPQVLEKLQSITNKSKNGQLSYNDYLAVIKLHTALNGK